MAFSLKKFGKRALKEWKWILITLVVIVIIYHFFLRGSTESYTEKKKLTADELNNKKRIYEDAKAEYDKAKRFYDDSMFEVTPSSLPGISAADYTAGDLRVAKQKPYGNRSGAIADNICGDNFMKSPICLDKNNLPDGATVDTTGCRITDGGSNYGVYNSSGELLYNKTSAGCLDSNAPTSIRKNGTDVTLASNSSCPMVYYQQSSTIVDGRNEIANRQIFKSSNNFPAKIIPGCKDYVNQKKAEMDAAYADYGPYTSKKSKKSKRKKRFFFF